MKVAIVFEAPDELSGANLTPEEFLRAYCERLFDIKITDFVVPKSYNLAEKKPLSVSEIVGDDPFCKQLPAASIMEASGITEQEIIEHYRRLEKEREAQAAIAPVVSDELIAAEKKRVDKEAHDRRQQHKFAVKFSNRRK